MRKAAVRAGLARSIATRGFDAAGQVGSAAAEVLRSRRDPAVVARRRQAAARKRVEVWAVGSGVSVAASAAAIVSVVDRGPSPMSVFFLIFALVFVAWCVTGTVRAARDLRLRSRVVAALPPPQPARRPVAGPARHQMDRLNSYSDSLRQLVGMIGLVDDATVLQTRRDVLSTADAAELRLRTLADELTGVYRARRSAPAPAAAELELSVTDLSARLGSGVEEYGRLVVAATDTVAASRALGRPVGAEVGRPADSQLAETTERLQALAAGMRELSRD